MIIIMMIRNNSDYNIDNDDGYDDSEIIMMMMMFSYVKFSTINTKTQIALLPQCRIFFHLKKPILFFFFLKKIEKLSYGVSIAQIPVFTFRSQRSSAYEQT
jgi:hypothetical protein